MWYPRLLLFALIGTFGLAGNASSQDDLGLTDPPQPTSPTQPQPGQRFILSGDQLKVHSASVNEAGAAAAIDGDEGTIWEVSGGWPQEIVLELPEDVHVTALRYIHGSRTANYLTQYRIYASPDGTNWINTSAPGTLNNKSDVWEVRMSWPKDARYVKLIYQGSGGGDSALTSEIQVVSDSPLPPPSSPPPMPEPQPAPPPTPSTPTAPTSCSTTPPPAGNGPTIYASPDGSGSACSASAPCDVQTGVNQLHSGDTLILQGGTYNLTMDNETLTIPTSASGSSGAHTRIRVADGATVILNGSIGLGDGLHHFTIDGLDGTLISNSGIGNAGAIFTFGSVSNIRFERFERIGGAQGFVGVFHDSVWSHLNVHHYGVDESGGGSQACLCEAEPAACGEWQPGMSRRLCHGVYTQQNSSGNVFDGNTWHDGEGWGLQLYGSGTATVINNTFIGGGGGVFRSGPSNMLVANNLVSHTGDGFWIGGNGQRLFNNTIVGNQGWGIFYPEGSGGEIRNNIVLDNAGGNIINDAGAATSNNLCNSTGSGCTLSGTAAETFVNPSANDYHLQSGSTGLGAEIGASGSAGGGCPPASSAPPPASQQPQPSAPPPAAQTPAAAPLGQVCYSLGGKDIPVEDYDPEALFNRNVGGTQITTTAYKDMASGELGDFGSRTTHDGVTSRGTGVMGGRAGEEIDQGEGIVMRFGGVKQTSLTVGLRDLYTQDPVAADGVETASWAAYRDGVAVAQGTVDATVPFNDETRAVGGGKAQFDISVPEGFDQLMFFSQEYAEDFEVEYIDAKATPGFDCAGKPLPSSDSNASTAPGSSGSSSSGSGSGSSSGGSNPSTLPPGSVCTGPRPAGSGVASVPLGNGATHYASPDGGGDCSAGSPCSLQTALNTLQPGGTLILQEGTYDNLPFNGDGLPAVTIPTDASGEDGAYTRIRVADGATVILNGGIELGDDLHHVAIDGLDGTLIIDGGENGSGGYSTVGLSTSDVHHMRFEQIEIRWVAGGWAGGVSDSEFIGLHIHHFGVTPDGHISRGCWDGVAGREFAWNPNIPPTGHCHGTYTQGDSRNNLFDGNLIHDGEGFAYHNYGTNATMINSVIHDNARGGIAILNGGEQVVSNNLIYNSGDGIIWGSDGQRVNNNTVVGGTGCGICLNGNGIEVRNNIVLDNAGGNITPVNGDASNNLCNSTGSGCTLAGTAAETFVNPAAGDFRSPAQGVGAAIDGTGPIANCAP